MGTIKETDTGTETTAGTQAAAGTDADDRRTSLELVDFIRRSPSMFHTVRTIEGYLAEAGFTRLAETDAWRVEPGGRYYTTRNGSSVVAWKVGKSLDGYHFQVAASHSDSPTFKVKSVPELVGPDEYLRLNVEAYGGMLDRTWFDRPLSLAGRVFVRDGARIESRLFSPDRDLALIPSVAIHFDRDANKGVATNRQVDLCPLVSAGRLGRGDFRRMVSAEVGVEPDQLLAYDLFLVNRQPASVWGWRDEFVSAPKLDDLQCAFSSLKAFLAAENDHDVSVFACFDNEEVGSLTKQGAMSTLLKDVLRRTNAALGRTEEDLHRALAGSFLVSCDNAHAVHPNHPEKTDDANKAHLNAGPVIKEAANQKYTTDAQSRAVLEAVCDAAGVPHQTFANRSDSAGGSTLGNLSNVQVSMRAADLGLPQLAMHSSYETGGVRDTAFAIRALEGFYRTNLLFDGRGDVTLA